MLKSVIATRWWGGLTPSHTASRGVMNPRFRFLLVGGCFYSDLIGFTFWTISKWFFTQTGHCGVTYCGTEDGVTRWVEATNPGCCQRIRAGLIKRSTLFTKAIVKTFSFFFPFWENWDERIICFTLARTTGVILLMCRLSCGNVSREHRANHSLWAHSDPVSGPGANLELARLTGWKCLFMGHSSWPPHNLGRECVILDEPWT